MIDAFEITLRFLGVVVVKEYLDINKPNDDFNKLLIEKLFKKMSLGDRLSICRDGSRCLVEEENLFFPELNAYAIRKGSGKPKNAKIMESYDKLFSVRNKFKGHSTNCTEKEYHDLYDECIPHMEAIWGGLYFLADYEYLAVKITKGDHVIDIYQKLNGVKDIEEFEDRNIEGIAIEEGDFLIISKEGKVFNLSPLLYFYISYEEEEEYCCLYEENAIKNGFFKMINYLGILPNNQTWHFKAEENMDDYREVIQQFNRLFAYLLGAEKNDFFENKVINALKELTNLGEFDLVQDVLKKYTSQDQIKDSLYIRLLNLNIDVTHLRGEYSKAVTLGEHYLADYSEEQILKDSQLLRMAIRKLHHSMFWLPVDNLIIDAKEF